MSNTLAVLIATIEASAAWAGITGFISFYHFGSPWRASLVGRTIMYLAMSLWLLLTLALVGRWIDPDPALFQYLALTTYGILALMCLRLLVTLVLAQRGTISVDQPNYTPFRTWWRGRRGEKVNDG